MKNLVLGKMSFYVRQITMLLFLMASVPSLLADDTYHWHSLPMGGGGFVTGLITSPQESGLMYARTDVGGAYRWIDDKQCWQPLLDFLPESERSLMGVESMAIDPSSPNKLYLYCGTSYWNNGLSAILYSEDYGDTFTRISTVTDKFPAHGNGGGRQSGKMLAVNPYDGQMLLCGSRTRGLWRSIDAGITWKRTSQSTFPNDTKIAFVQFIDSATTVVGMQRKGNPNIYITTDTCATWTPIEGQRTDLMVQRCAYSPSALIFTYADDMGPGTGGSGAVMKYHLPSGTWTDISPASGSYGGISIATDNPDYMVATTLGIWRSQPWLSTTTTWGDHIYVTRDGGASWTNLMDDGRAVFHEPTIAWMRREAQLHWCGCAVIDPFNPQRAFFTSGQGIFTTENLFAPRPNFRMAVAGLEETVPSGIVSVEGAPLLTSIYDYDGFMYHDLDSYSPRYTPSMGSTNAIAMGGTNHMVMLRVGGSVYHSSNSGSSWSKLPNPSGAGHMVHCAVSAQGSVLFVTPNNGVPRYTTNKGNTWNVVQGLPSESYVYADPLLDNVFYSVSSDKLYILTYDRATNQIDILTRSVPNIVNTRLCVAGGRSGELWIARGSSGLLHVTDAHTSNPTLNVITMNSATCVGVGKPCAEDAPLTPYVWGCPNSSQSIGMYRSTDDGATWERINDDSTLFAGPGNAQLVVGDMNEYGRVYMSSVGRGVVTGYILP